jgi:hypothetical protein
MKSNITNEVIKRLDENKKIEVVIYIWDISEKIALAIEREMILLTREFTLYI